MAQNKKYKNDNESFAIIYLGLFAVLIGFLVPIFTPYSVKFSDASIESDFIILVLVILGTRLLAKLGVKEELNTSKSKASVDEKMNFRSSFFFYGFHFYQAISYGYVSFFFSSIMALLFISQ